MDDTRIQTAKTEAHEAMVELDSDQPNIRRAIALLDDSRNGIVDVVEGGLSGGCSKADLNQLDSARMYINKAISMLTKSSSHRCCHLAPAGGAQRKRRAFTQNQTNNTRKGLHD